MVDAPNPVGNLFGQFCIYYSGSISASDVNYARIYDPAGHYWQFDPNTYLNAAGNYVSTYYCYESTTDGNALPLGTWRADIKLNNGNESTYNFTMTAPGSASMNGCTVVKNENDTNYYPAAASAVARPSITTVSGAASQITINFTLSDSRIKNGFVWFYDGSMYIGSFAYFYDGITGLRYTGLGSDLNLAGTNTIVIKSTDITFNAGYGLSNITSCRVVATDGAQYWPAHPAYYDYRAVSLSEAVP